MFPELRFLYDNSKNRLRINRLKLDNIQNYDDNRIQMLKTRKVIQYIYLFVLKVILFHMILKEK